MTENEEFIFGRFLISIKSGFESQEDIIADTLESVEDEGWENEISEEWIRTNVNREYEKHAEKSKTWQYPTDPDRLRLAFDKLCRENIIALHNAGYETSDAIYDAGDIWKDAEDAGLHPIGYCYYHGQDLERVIEDDILMIGFYGAAENNDKKAITIGNKVVEVLKNAGFEVEWNGSAKQRIAVPNFKWHNLFTNDDDVEQKWGYERILGLMSEN